MKILSLLILTAFTLHAQDFAVKFYGPGNSQGLPQYWPQIVQSGTNVPTGFVLLSLSQLANIVATNQAAYNSWESNKLYLAETAKNANITRLLILYEQIPAARTILANDLITITNIEQSLASGTNSQAQVVTKIRQINGNCANHVRIEQGILEILQRLGPVLRQIYRPEEDDTD